MKSIVKICFVLSVLLASSIAMGANATWTNGSADQDWFNGGNWDTVPAVPGVTDVAHINTALPAAIVNATGTVGRVVLDGDGILQIGTTGNLTVVKDVLDPTLSGDVLLGNAVGSTGNLVVDGQLTANHVAVGNADGTGNLTVNASGSISTDSWMIPGFLPGSTGSIVVDGGQITTGEDMQVGFQGNGSITLNSGSVTVTGNGPGALGLGALNIATLAGSVGTVTINGGVFTSGALNLNGAGGTNHGVATLAIHGGKFIDNFFFVMADNSTIIIDGGELIIFGQTAAEMTGQINTVGTWDFGTGFPVVVTNGDGSVSITNNLDTLFTPIATTIGNATAVQVGQHIDIFGNPASQTVFADSDPNLPPVANFVEWKVSAPVSIDSVQLTLQHDSGVPNRAATNFKLLAKTFGSPTFDVVLLNQAIPSVPYPFGVTYDEPNLAVPNTSFFKEFRAEFTPWAATGATSGVRVLFVGAKGTTGLRTDLNVDRIVDTHEMGVLAQNWLVNNLDSGFLANIILDDYEGYANQAALDVNYFPAIWDTGVTTTTLLTGANQALRWNYDNSGTVPIFSETIFLLPAPLDISKYDEFRIRLNRHVGNSKENNLYVRFLNGGFAQSNESLAYIVDFAAGSTQVPSGWNQWVIDLHQPNDFRNGFTEIGQLTNVQAVVIGTSGGQPTAPGSGGTGTIDFDDLTLIDNVLVCAGVLETDFNADCTTNLLDFSIIAQDWMMTY